MLHRLIKSDSGAALGYDAGRWAFHPDQEGSALMKRQDARGLILLAVMVVLLIVAGWFLLRASNYSMRENMVGAPPQSGQPPAPQ